MTSIQDWTVGLSICFDLRFPALYRHYGLAGADLVVVPAAFTKTTGQAHWSTLLRARAIEMVVLWLPQGGVVGRRRARNLRAFCRLRSVGRLLVSYPMSPVY